MRKFVGLILFLCLWTLSAKAQDYSKGEAFVGYQYTHANGPDLNGWNGALTYNLKDWLGVTADLSGTYGTGAKLHTFLFGPTLPITRLKTETFRPFAHVLFGGAIASDGVSSGAFAVALGGGLDVKVSERLSARLPQADWMLFRSSGNTTTKNARLSFGLVYRF